MPLTPTPLVGTSVSPMANSSSIQPLTHSPVNITPISMEMLNSATSGAIVSLPSSFCFPSNQMGVASNAANSGATAQLNAMSLGSMFSVNPAGMSPQFVQPLTVAQQQALTLSLSQQQHQGQNLPVSHSITIGQVPQNMGIVSQPLPLGQVVCSSVASPNLSFMTPTVFTMSNPTGQNQYLSNPYSPFPIMLGNQQNIFTSINTAATLPSQSVEASSVSQVSGPSPLPQIPHSLQMPSNLTNSMSHITNHQVSLSQLSSNSISLTQIPNTPVSLDSQPVSVFSFPSPAMSINLPTKSLEINSQPSPDTTNSHPTDSVIVNNNSAEFLPKSDISNIVSSSTSSSFYPASSPSPVSESKDILTTIKKELSPVILLDVKPHVGCARMKYTPIEKDNSRMTDVRKNLVIEESCIENPEAENIGSELAVDRATPEINFKSLGIKIEICDELGQENDGNKHSLSPIESLELVKKKENHSESNTKADTMGDLADGNYNFL